MTPTSGLNDLLEWLTKLRETFVIVCQIITKGIIKDTDEQPGKQVHRVRYGRAPRAGASVLVHLGCTTFLDLAVLANSETLSTMLF